jgi:hypothetical protein
LYIHGVVMTGWIVLLVAQTGLVAIHRVQWHRQLGVFGSLWAALVVLFGSITTLHAATREVRRHTEFAIPEPCPVANVSAASFRRICKQRITSCK